MNLKYIKSVIDRALKKAPGCDPKMHVQLGDKVYPVKEIGRYGVSPGVLVVLADEPLR